ncbi:hypothetical protein [Robertkochia aurantiaca]|uniref:hypothetical protein n=1 Tax=Robertkochia aurantiaca TaxID=2873700 RepID=UPI001CCEDBB1|nr:hypothetical protein [Robertkochia sp. 3YJGBD-33]
MKNGILKYLLFCLLVPLTSNAQSNPEVWAKYILKEARKNEKELNSKKMETELPYLVFYKKAKSDSLFMTIIKRAKASEIVGPIYNLLITDSKSRSSKNYAGYEGQFTWKINDKLNDRTDEVKGAFVIVFDKPEYPQFGIKIQYSENEVWEYLGELQGNVSPEFKEYLKSLEQQI